MRQRTIRKSNFGGKNSKKSKNDYLSQDLYMMDKIY